jgi:L-proline amide hydrolase
MSMTVAAHEGYIPFRGFKTWYRVVGDDDEPGRLPLLTLHGGPGAAHDYLEPLEAMAATGRRVIFYDQLGCGNSGLPEPAPSLWTTDLYLDEIDVVRKFFGLDQFHLFGHSWGGMLAMEFALTQPAGLASLTIASSPASMTQWVTEANRLRTDLPSSVQQTLLEHEGAGTTDSSAYEAAMQVFYARHLCRTEPWPECLVRTFTKLQQNPEVYFTMNGPSEFHVTGTLKDWNIVDRLGEIHVPTLVTSGRYDEATPAIAEVVHRGIVGSEWVLFESSAHCAHAEEPDTYLAVLSGFLSRIEHDMAR